MVSISDVDEHGQVIHVNVPSVIGKVVLCISLEHDGDMEAFLPVAGARLLLSSIEEAILLAEQHGGNSGEGQQLEGE